MKTVTKTVDNLAKVAAGIRLLAETRVMVGFPQDADKPRKDGEPINNATLGYIHDNGAPEAGIPARPFMRPGIKDSATEVQRRFKLAGKAALDAKPDSAMRQMEAAGMIAASAVKARINSNIQPALADSTLAARKRRGVKRTNTLVDTGQMRNAVTYVVRKVK